MLIHSVGLHLSLQWSKRTLRYACCPFFPTCVCTHYGEARDSIGSMLSFSCTILWQDTDMTTPDACSNCSHPSPYSSCLKFGCDPSVCASLRECNQLHKHRCWLHMSCKHKDTSLSTQTGESVFKKALLVSPDQWLQPDKSGGTKLWSVISWFTKPRRSHDLSQCAVPFIIAWAKRSTAPNLHATSFRSQKTLCGCNRAYATIARCNG